MKITILALHLGYGGIEKFVSNIANMFAENNEVEIISVYKLYEKPPFYIDPKIKITYLLGNLKPNRREFYDSIKSLNIFNFLKQTYISLKILFLKKYKMKKAIQKVQEGIVISTIHQHNKLVSKYCKKSIKKIATEHNYKDTNKSYVKKVIKSCNNIDYMVIASKQLSNFYLNKFNHCKVINIPLGLDSIPEHTSKLNKKNITYIGRLSYEKGILDLIEVFRIIHSGDKDFILNIIGDGELKKDIIEKIEMYKLENNVILHGYKNKEEIEKILLETSIGINTSYTESFGLAILESFSYGIPCVAFDSAEGIKEIIDNNENGYIIPGRNFKIMADKIIKLIGDKKRLEEFGTSARKKSLLFKANNIYSNWKKIM